MNLKTDLRRAALLVSTTAAMALSACGPAIWAGSQVIGYQAQEERDQLSSMNCSQLRAAYKKNDTQSKALLLTGLGTNARINKSAILSVMRHKGCRLPS